LKGELQHFIFIERISIKTFKMLMNSMKRFIVLIVVFLSLYSCRKNADNFSDRYIILDEFITENYTYDAKQLYMHELLQDSTNPNYENPMINQSQVNQILKIIQAVYNINSPESDTVFNIYQIHSFYCYSLNSISLTVDPDNTGIYNLSRNSIPTGDPDLDYLLLKYEFDSVRTSYNYPESSWMILYTNKEFNFIPAEDEFSQLESVHSAEFNKWCIGGGNTITMERNGNTAIITFGIGWGDCPAGCIHHKYWEFTVTNGIAEFTRSYE
jgi:hypothetical protein